MFAYISTYVNIDLRVATRMIPSHTNSLHVEWNIKHLMTDPSGKS